MLLSFKEKNAIAIYDIEYEAATGEKLAIGSVKRFEVCEQFQRRAGMMHEVHLWMGDMKVAVYSFDHEPRAIALWEVLAACLVKDAEKGVRPDGR
jgi:hypothetical protein